MPKVNVTPRATRSAVRNRSTVRTTRAIIYRDGTIIPEGTVGLVVQCGFRCRVEFANFTRMVDRDDLEAVDTP